ncbi:uncharacterized protein B0T23DRAFT_328197, partial [Neurospora hispaniola]
LLKRFIINIVEALIYDIKNILDKGLVAALITINIKGAFNIVLINRLVLYLYE